MIFLLRLFLWCENRNVKHRWSNFLPVEAAAELRKEPRRKRGNRKAGRLRTRVLYYSHLTGNAGTGKKCHTTILREQSVRRRYVGCM
jgi:hypothetical protein